MRLKIEPGLLCHRPRVRAVGGVPKDLQKAAELMKIAAAADVPKAANFAKSMEDELNSSSA